MEKKTVRTTKSTPRSTKSAVNSLERAVANKSATPLVPEDTTPILDTVALRLESLQKGMMYSCILSGKDKVHYIGNNKIRWYSPAEDDYKESVVYDYQLRPLIAAQTNG